MEKNKNNHYRHGDLILGRSSEEVSGMEKVASRTFVLAEGETTGHKHVIASETGTVDIYRSGSGEIYVAIDGKASVSHDEHSTIEIPSGTYKLGRQREYDYFEMKANQVID